MPEIRPIEIDTTQVPLNAMGEELRPILWRGRQWAVTTFGLEALDGAYQIQAGRLEEEFSEWSWLMQMGEKSWIDMPDFTTAFMVAIVLHGRTPGFDRAQIMDDFRRGMKLQDERA